ncbi:MAG: DUF192 domain-containing protein [Parcubacteria group bacterium]|nr:DUF192 domain-containing protein [Parcubacteria group bacterium]
MRRLIIIGIILFLGASAVFLQKEKDAQTEQRTIRIGDRELLVEIADTLRFQIRGLSGRPSLGEREGMLFVYENPQVLSFWMKDMRFAIDIIWIDGNGIIVRIAANVSPDTFPQTFSSMVPVQYVLEVPAGWAERHGVVAGDRLVW